MSWMQLHNGTRFPLDEPDATLLSIHDIAHSLSLQCRFTGHCTEFYSVAEHAYWCSMMAPDEYKFEALMHDAVEAVIGDVGAPLKSLLSTYRNVEAVHDEAIRTMYGLPPKMSDAVKEVDMRMLVTERNQIMRRCDTPWGVEHFEPYDVKLQCWPWHVAKAMFLQRFEWMTSPQAA